MSGGGGGGIEDVRATDVGEGRTGDGAVADVDTEIAGQALGVIDFVRAVCDPAGGAIGPGRGVADPNGGIGRKDEGIENIERETNLEGVSDLRGTAAEGGAIDPNRGKPDLDGENGAIAPESTDADP